MGAQAAGPAWARDPLFCMRLSRGPEAKALPAARTLTITLLLSAIGCASSALNTVIGTPAPATPFQVPDSANYRVLHSFSGSSDGYYPGFGSLTNVNGILYGTTERGGTFNYGVVFSITLTGKERVLYRFGKRSYSGEFPDTANLLLYDGKLYGTTTSDGGYNGDGTVYSLTLSGKERTLYKFGKNGRYDGATPTSLIDVNGVFLGTTGAGGTFGDGTVYRITPTGNESIFYNFGKTKNDGIGPAANVIEVSGTLYGTTQYGGAHDQGTVFKVDGAGNETVLHSFGKGNDGQDPVASLTDVGGKLYGTTPRGGANGEGTAFVIEPSGAERVLHSFGGRNDGIWPYGALLNVKGTMYGTTECGGAYGWSQCLADHAPGGTIFALTTAGTERVVYSFGKGRDASQPLSTLTEVSGTLYGTSNAGGAHGEVAGGFGTAFALKL